MGSRAGNQQCTCSMENSFPTTKNCKTVQSGFLGNADKPRQFLTQDLAFPNHLLVCQNRWKTCLYPCFLLSNHKGQERETPKGFSLFMATDTNKKKSAQTALSIAAELCFASISGTFQAHSPLSLPFSSPSAKCCLSSISTVVCLQNSQLVAFNLS